MKRTAALLFVLLLISFALAVSIILESPLLRKSPRRGRVNGNSLEVNAPFPRNGNTNYREPPTVSEPKSKTGANGGSEYGIMHQKKKTGPPEAKMGFDFNDSRLDVDPLMSSFHSEVSYCTLFKRNGYTCAIPQVPAQYGAKFWVNKTHKKCSERKKKPFIHLQGNTLTLDCQGEYSTASDACEGDLRGAWKQYTGKVDVGDAEMIWGRCNNEHQLILRAVPRQPLLAKLKAASETVWKGKSKPPSILFVVMDSLSQQHFQRKLPLSDAFLRSFEENTDARHKLFDFPFHTVVGDNTAPNTVAMLSGMGVMSTPAWRAKSAQFKWVFDEFARNGYATFFGDDSSDHFPEDWPQTYRPKTHHHTHWFNHCAGKWVQSCNDGYMDRRCISHNMVVQYLFNYTSDFLEAYKDFGRWSYIHILEGHEETGSVISTVDSALQNFLSDTTQNHDDLFVVVMGDHGMRYGRYRGTLGGSVEYRLPLLRVLAPKAFLKEHPKFSEALQSNSRHLVTKYDIFHFQHDLLKLAVGSLDDATLAVPGPSASLARPLPDRTCREAWVPEPQCPCSLKYISINETTKYPQVLQLAKDLIAYINNYIRKFNAQSHCPSLVLDHVKNYATVDYDLFNGRPERVQLVTFVSRAPSKARFEATVRRRSGEPEQINIARISAFSSGDKATCEPYAKSIGMDAFFCVCPRTDFI